MGCHLVGGLEANPSNPIQPLRDATVTARVASYGIMSNLNPMWQTMDIFKL